jgi:hypothetical protein
MSGRCLICNPLESVGKSSFVPVGVKVFSNEPSNIEDPDNVSVSMQGSKIATSIKNDLDIAVSEVERREKKKCYLSIGGRFVHVGVFLITCLLAMSVIAGVSTYALLDIGNNNGSQKNSEDAIQVEHANNTSKDEVVSVLSIPCADNEETCYDEMYNAVSCAPIASGGCPCPVEGQVRCGGDASISFPGTCEDICCEPEEEMCLDENSKGISCAPIASGGCPCPVEGQTKCGGDASIGYAGHCEDICCEPEEEMCLDEKSKGISCAPIASGGCPCPVEGQTKCGGDASIGYAGYCDDAC